MVKLMRYTLAALLLMSLPLGFMACATSAGPQSQAKALLADDEIEICVIRHAEAYKNTAKTPKDHSPDDLTPTGEAQAKALAEAMRDQGDRTYKVLTSPELRAQYTAKPIAAAMGQEFQTSDELRPLKGNMTYEARYKAWQTGQDPRPDEGEALRDGRWRVKTLLQRVMLEAPPRSRTIMITHGDIAPVILGEPGQVPLLERPFKHPVEVGQFACVAMNRKMKL